MNAQTTARTAVRIRFNWGYHDGAQARAEGWPYRYTHFDKTWLAGFQAGHADGGPDGKYVMDSTKAWEARAALAKAGGL